MAKIEAPTTHGWFLDPKDPKQLRFWSGNDWTTLTKFPTADELADAQIAGDPSSGAPIPRPPVRDSAPVPVPRSSNATPTARPRPSPATREPEEQRPLPLILLEENPYTAATMVLMLIEIVVAIVTGIALISLVPAAVSVQAIRRREKAAFIAALAAAGAIVVGIGTRH